MTKQELIDWATRHGYKMDRYGHMQQTVGEETYRLKLSTVAVRKECKTAAGWVRLRSGYYSALSLDDRDKIIGLKISG